MPKGEFANHARADKCARWNDGKIISSHGYAKIRIGRTHPLADPNGYAYEHLVVWVSAGNPRPGENEVIHHRNGVKTDNRIENLNLLTRQAHEKEHGRLELSDEEVRNMRILYASGEYSQQELAGRYRTSSQRISKMIRGKARASAGGPIDSRDHRQRDPETGRFTR